MPSPALEERKTDSYRYPRTGEGVGQRSEPRRGGVPQPGCPTGPREAGRSRTMAGPGPQGSGDWGGRVQALSKVVSDPCHIVRTQIQVCPFLKRPKVPISPGNSLPLKHFLNSLKIRSDLHIAHTRGQVQVGFDLPGSMRQALVTCPCPIEPFSGVCNPCRKWESAASRAPSHHGADGRADTQMPPARCGGHAGQTWDWLQKQLEPGPSAPLESAIRSSQPVSHLPPNRSWGTGHITASLIVLLRLCPVSATNCQALRGREARSLRPCPRTTRRRHPCTGSCS